MARTQLEPANGHPSLAVLLTEPDVEKQAYIARDLHHTHAKSQCSNWPHMRMHARPLHFADVRCFRAPSSEVAEQNLNKIACLPHVRKWVIFENSRPQFGVSSPYRTWGPQNCPYFRWFYGIATRHKREYLRNETRRGQKDCEGSLHCCRICWTLAHKRLTLSAIHGV